MTTTVRRFKLLRNHLTRWVVVGPCLLLFPLAISLSGCLVAAVGAAAGAGAYAYYQGNVSGTYPAEFGETYQCTKSALTDLAMPVLSEHHEGLNGTIESSIEDGSHVTIKLEEKPRILATDTHQTEVTIRVGVFGDSKVSTRLQQQIGQHIAQKSPQKGSNTRLPPITNNAIVQGSPPPGVVPAGGSEWKPASQANPNQKAPPP